VSSESGAASLIGAAILAVGLVLGLLVSDVARLVEARSRLLVAADAAALAAAPVTFAPFGAVGSPTAEATRFADANGAELIDCRCPIDQSWSQRDIVVTVGGSVDLVLLGHREIQATAAARFRPIELSFDWP
jgi:hypothetical protein